MIQFCATFDPLQISVGFLLMTVVQTKEMNHLTSVYLGVMEY